MYIYLKLSNVRSWVISLKSSSLKAAKTFKSLTKISTAFARSRLYKIKRKKFQANRVTINSEKHFQVVINKNVLREYKIELKKELEEAYLSKASRYFCFRISKKIFMEYLLSSTFVKPDKYFSTSSHSPFVTISSKYLMLKKNPDSCSNLKRMKLINYY